MAFETAATRRSFLRHMGSALGGVALLAACGGGTTATPPSATAPAAPTPATAPTTTAPTSAAKPATAPNAAPTTAQLVLGSGKTELIWTSWATDTYGQFRVQEQANNFLKDEADANTTIRIRNESSSAYMDKLLTQLAGGVGPDVYRLGWENVYPLYKQQQLVELDSLYAKSKDNYLTSADTKPGIIDKARIKGKLYGFPMGGDIKALFINRSLLKSASVTEPPNGFGDPSWTYDKLLEMAKQLTKRNADGTPQQFGYAVSTGWDFVAQDVYAHGGTLFNEDMSELMLHTPPGYEAIQRAADYRNVHKVAPTAADNDGGAFNFVNGRLAFEESQVSQMSYRTQDVKDKFEWDMVTWPQWQPTPQVAAFHFSAWVINAHSKHADEAWRFMHYICGPVGTRVDVELGWAVPLYKSLDPTYNKRIEQWKKNTIPAKEGLDHQQKEWAPSQPAFKEVWDTIKSALDPVWIGKKTAKDAISEVKPKVDGLLKKGLTA